MTANRLLSLRAAVILFIGSSVSFAADGWSQLRVGMTRGEASAVLGQALLTTQARGFTIEIYDQGAEVLLIRGRVAGWTAPATVLGGASTRVDAWQFSSVPASSGKGVSAKSNNEISPRTEKVRRNAALPSYRL
jgi:hypothetical protein